MTLKLAVLAPVSTNKYNKRILAAIKPVVPSDVVVDAFNLSPKEAHRHIENPHRHGVQRLFQWLKPLGASKKKAMTASG